MTCPKSIPKTGRLVSGQGKVDKASFLTWNIDRHLAAEGVASEDFFAVAQLLFARLGLGLFLLVRLVLVVFVV